MVQEKAMAARAQRKPLPEADLVLGMVSLAAVFARVLSRANPGLRAQLEAEATAEFQRLDREENKTAATALMMFLRELHEISLQRKT
jgi:hypothetical protein